MRLIPRSYLDLSCSVMVFLFFALSLTSSTLHSAESTQILVTGNSAIQLVQIDRGLTMDLVTSRTDDLNPICLPNGRGIVFVRGAGKGRQLFIWHPQKKQPIQLTFDLDVKITFGVSPDGNRIAFVSNKTKQLYILEIDTGQSIQMTSTFSGDDWGGPQSPVWSPDGKRLAFASFERDSYKSSFHVLDIMTRRLTTLSLPLTNAPHSWSPWSPDGTKLALSGLGRTNIVDVSTDKPRIVRELAFYSQDVHWSPDGTKLAYTHGNEGKYCDNVYVVDFKTGATKRVNSWFLEYRCFHGPRWSPDSKKLAFLGYFSRGDMSLFGPDSISDQLYVADHDLNVRRLTEDLKERNVYGVSWCNTPLALGR